MWKHVAGKGSAHYSVMTTEKGINSLDALRQIFKGGRADELNFALFSTSGVHGTYNTIEEAEKAINNEKDEDGDEYSKNITFLVVHPRLVALRYGCCTAHTPEDIQFLKTLRETSLNIVKKIGMP